MRYWVFFTDITPGHPKARSGWIRAETLEEAFELVDDPAAANLVEIPDDLGFPPEAVGPVTWEAIDA